MKFLLLSVFVMFSYGCVTVNANLYRPSSKTQATLAESKYKEISIGSVQSANAEVETVYARMATLKSPYKGTFAGYIKSALKIELQKAKIFAQNSDYEISCALQKNVVDANGISVGEGEIEAKFTVKENGGIVFDKVVSATHQWKSAFIAGFAVSAAKRSYPVLVRNLLINLFNDPEFISIIKL